MKKIKHDFNWHRYNGCELCVYWRREDSLDDCVRKTSDFFNDFIKLHPDGLPLRCAPQLTREKLTTYYYDVVPSFDELKNLIVAGISTSYIGEGSKVAYDTATKLVNYNRYISIQLECCCKNNQYNQSQVQFPPKNDEAADIVSKDFFKNCFDLFVKHWQPKKGFIRLPYLRIWEYTSAVFHDVGWLTYFSEGLGELPKLPDWAKIIPAEGYGTYIQVSEELPDYKNENEFNEIVDKMIELSKIISPWLKTKRDLII
jgi:hypothetical protein